METRVAIIGIIIENIDSVEKLNDIFIKLNIIFEISKSMQLNIGCDTNFFLNFYQEESKPSNSSFYFYALG